jgi:hypothetical protein
VSYQPNLEFRKAALRVGWLFVIVVLVCVVMVFVTGCTSMDAKNKTLFCVLLCIEVETEIKKGDDPKDAAPSSLDGMITPDRSRAGSPARLPAP